MQQRLPETGVFERKLDVCLEVANAVACIMVSAFEADAEKRLILAKQIERVGELYFSTRIRTGLSNGIPNGRLQEIAAKDT